MDKTNDNEFTLTRSQFAKSIGKSTGSVKIAMRRGKYADSYIYKNGQYYFRPQECTRANHVNVPGTNSSNVPIKKVNRGNHLRGNYKNIKGNNADAFRYHNKMKRAVAVLKDIPEDVADRYLTRIDKMMADDEARDKKRIVDADRKLNRPSKNYGGLYSTSSRTLTFETNWNPLEPVKKDEYDKYLEENDLAKDDGPTYY